MTGGGNPRAELVAVSVTIASRVAGNGDGGIGPLNVRKPLSVVPAFAALALTVKDVNVTPEVFSDSVLNTNWPPSASMVTSNENGTGIVVIVKFTDVLPAGTVTAPGTDAYAGRLLSRRIDLPPAGAGPGSVTVPVAECPPVTAKVSIVSNAGATSGCGSTEIVPCAPTPPSVA
jgi:hypothetical protein